MVKGWNVVFIVALLVLLAACGQEAEAPNNEGQDDQEGVEEMNDWQLEVQTNQNEGTLLVEMTLTNETGESQTIEFPSSQMYELVLTDESDEEVYRFSEDMMFTMAIVEDELAAGDSRSYEETISVNDLDSGSYTLLAEIVGKPTNDLELPSATIDIEITK
ncbi:BsuPI-related putative proteinase inhibitor [Alkalicoccobacillus murimartini]|uniref:Intracellular proteinase inhibitor BsuPI domain-containing protein n=1 Tax=Alkalicoccobacillus murimartini TaxID=171685 RepID=A0ABT9YJA9_9BACI|nr:BsuPI-related putative proteinase inhibitor [Alkalicoccobacillus murimartini]MDQ0207948.1 hypothetical protein [Alkalicoccobacillus murimartini]